MTERTRDMRLPTRASIYPRVARVTFGVSAALRARRLSGGRVVVRHAEIDAGLGVRFVLVSDIHADSGAMARERIREIVSDVNRIGRVAAVLMPGDFVGHQRDAIDWCAAELSRLHAPAFASLGNHDLILGRERVIDALTTAGITMLVNRAVEIETGVWIGGLDSTRGEPDAARMSAVVPAEARCVVLGHEPALAPMHEQVLHVAGHTHHGQIRLRGGRPLVLPSHSRPYPAGLYEVTDAGPRRWVYTTAGVGCTTVPIRMGAPPEIVVIDA
jgi:predicted MPP superfamily phosphohydrolase